MNHIIIPLFPGFRIKLKIGAGVVFSALSPITALVIQLVITRNDFSCSDAGFSCHQPVKLFWIVIPVIFLSIGSMHIFTAGMPLVASLYYCGFIDRLTLLAKLNQPNFAVAIVIITAGLEFIYAQSPNSMKGLLTGLFYLWYGIFNAAGIIFYGNSVANQEHKTRSGIIHSAITTCIGVASVLLYMVMACLYKNRVRPTDRDDIEDDAVRRGMYGNVSTLNFPDR